MSDLYLQIKFARMVGQTVQQYTLKKDSPYHGIGRCPLCGDSKTNMSKKRFHVREHQGTIFVSCFNCGYSSNIMGYMKVYNPLLYSDFIFERLKVNGDTNLPVIVDQTKIVTGDTNLVKTLLDKKFLLELPYVKDLPQDHPVALYVASRRLPEYPFQYAEKFYEFSAQFNETLSGKKRDEPRLIIPFFDRNGNCFAYQGRDLSGKSLQKYITITVNPKIPKVFGIDRIDMKKPVIIVEGPIDSLFLPNCLASVNASLIATAKKVESGINKNLITICFDNEPRNEVIVNFYADAIKLGYSIVIWPRECEGLKDINDMVKNGLDVLKIIKNNTYQGLLAQLEFQKWKRI